MMRERMLSSGVGSDGEEQRSSAVDGMAQLPLTSLTFWDSDTDVIMCHVCRRRAGLGVTIYDLDVN